MTRDRFKFGSFFVGGQDKRPDSLKSISISNKVTPGTQIRIMILKLLAKRYHTSNPGSKVKVIGFEPRPTLKITPPEESSDKRVKTYTYIEAIQKLPTHFTEAEVEPIIAKARVHFQGVLKATFVVLDDDAPRRQRVVRPVPAPSEASMSEPHESDGSEPQLDREYRGPVLEPWQLTQASRFRHFWWARKPACPLLILSERFYL